MSDKPDWMKDYRECAAERCRVQIFDPDEDYCQHHEGQHIFDAMYGTSTAPPNDRAAHGFSGMIQRLLRRLSSVPDRQEQDDG